MLKIGRQYDPSFYKWCASNRHKGHVDHVNYSQFGQDLDESALTPLGADRTIRIDTTDFGKINEEEIAKTILNYLE